MKICVIGKLSPIQGGTSRQTFWFCHALARHGHDVHIATNGNEVEGQYKTFGGKIPGNLSGSPLADVCNRLTVHYTDANSRYAYIPFANPFVSKLASIAIDVVRRHDCDVILGSYMEPYGVAASLAAHLRCVPFGLRHAGSDVGGLLQSRELDTLYIQIVKQASFILVTNSTFRRLTIRRVDELNEKFADYKRCLTRAASFTNNAG